MVRSGLIAASLVGLFAAPALAQLSAQGGPIQVNADSSEVMDRQREVVVSGNVDIVQGRSRLRADRVILNYTGNQEGVRAEGIGGGFGDISRMRAEGNVFYVTPDLKARGDSGVYDAVSGQIVLTGNVILNRGEDVARGCELTMQVSAGESVLKGCDDRVRMVIMPKSSQETSSPESEGSGEP